MCNCKRVPTCFIWQDVLTPSTSSLIGTLKFLQKCRSVPRYCILPQRRKGLKTVRLVYWRDLIPHDPIKFNMVHCQTTQAMTFDFAAALIHSEHNNEPHQTLARSLDRTRWHWRNRATTWKEAALSFMEHVLAAHMVIHAVVQMSGTVHDSDFNDTDIQRPVPSQTECKS